MQIKQRWTMYSSDILVVGMKLGYDCNAINKEVSNEGFYIQGGTGAIFLDKASIEKLGSEQLKVVFRHIFATYPDLEEVRIINNH